MFVVHFLMPWNMCRSSPEGWRQTSESKIGPLLREMGKQMLASHYCRDAGRPHPERCEIRSVVIVLLTFDSCAEAEKAFWL